MARHFILLTLISVFIATIFLANAFYSSISIAQTTIQPTPDQATIERAKNEFMANICANHGGINCSIIRPDAFVVCNDGTVDESHLIYTIPACHESISNIIDQESNFMVESGCYPPSEMGCFSNESFENLTQILKSNRLIDSELGKEELNQCRNQIRDFNYKNEDFKQCLVKNNRPQFNPSGKNIVPLLKAIFCPIFYGDHSSYDFDNNLCLCDSGYFMLNNVCTDGLSICQTKYGSGALVKNGNCIVSSPTPIKQSGGTEPTPFMPIYHTPPNNISTTNISNLNTEHYPQGNMAPEVSQIQNFNQPKINIFKNMLNSIISNIKNLFELL